jgi:hypothetical protein
MPTTTSVQPIAQYEPVIIQAVATSRLKIDRLAQKLLWLAVPLTAFLAVTRQSIWMDEGYTVWFAAHQKFSSFFPALIGAPGSTGDPQMLFYLTYMWGWTKIFGYSELALRAANIPFFIILLVAVSWATRKLAGAANLWIVVCLSPFVWFYLNDARPYVALMAFAAGAIVSLMAYLLDPAKYRKTAPWICLISLLFAWGTHILAAFLVPALVVLVVAAAMETPELKTVLLRDWLQPVAFIAPFFLALGGFYAWASSHGVNKEIGDPGTLNLGFIFYEFLGFAGLGTPRLELRENPIVQTLAPYAALLILGALPLIALCFFLVRNRPPRLVLPLLASLVAGIAIALGVSKFEHFQVLGRHVAVFAPLLLITILYWVGQQVSQTGRTAAIAALSGIVLMWAISDLRLVSMPKYEKDDVREAARIAATASNNGARVLWVADTYAAEYYGVTALRSDRPTKSVMENELGRPVSVEAIDGQNWNSDVAGKFIDSSASPVVLVVSRPDLFDKQGVWRTLVEQRHASEIASLPAFSIYEFQPAKSAAVATLGKNQPAIGRDFKTRLIGHTQARPSNL